MPRFNDAFIFWGALALMVILFPLIVLCDIVGGRNEEEALFYEPYYDR